jgi:hypothetical protein
VLYFGASIVNVAVYPAGVCCQPEGPKEYASDNLSGVLKMTKNTYRSSEALKRFETYGEVETVNHAVGRGAMSS